MYKFKFLISETLTLYDNGRLNLTAYLEMISDIATLNLKLKIHIVLPARADHLNAGTAV